MCSLFSAKRKKKRFYCKNNHFCNFSGCGSRGKKHKGKQFHFCDSSFITHISGKECLLNKEPQSGTCQNQTAQHSPLYSRHVLWVIAYMQVGTQRRGVWQCHGCPISQSFPLKHG